MSHPKPTPRHIPRVSTERLPDQAPTYTPHHGVIPIRPETPATEPTVAAAPSLTPAIATTTAAAVATAVTKRKRAKPVDKRPWRVLVVPMAAGAPTRAFDLARWQARLATGMLVVLLLGSAGFVATIVLALSEPDIFVSGTEAALLRTELTAVKDSLALARIALTEGAEESMDTSIVSSDASPAGGATAPLASGTRSARRPLLGRTDARDASVRPRLAEGLPVMGMIASTFSRARRHPLLHIVRPHLGVDVAAPSGTRISAPAGGRVRFVGRRFAVGLVVEIDHGRGVITRYAHCRAALVKAGDMVTPGMAIATVGSSGLSTGPHLHYEVLVRGVQVDPMRYRISQQRDSAAASTAGAVTAPAAGAGPLVPAREEVTAPSGSGPAPGSGPT